MDTAQSIAVLFGEDGQSFDSKIGNIFDVCNKMSTKVDQSWKSESTKYTFDDNSSIVISGDCWDTGHKECFCMSENGHTEDCVTNFCNGCESWLNCSKLEHNDCYIEVY